MAKYCNICGKKLKNEKQEICEECRKKGLRKISILLKKLKRKNEI